MAQQDSSCPACCSSAGSGQRTKTCQPEPGSYSCRNQMLWFLIPHSWKIAGTLARRASPQIEDYAFAPARVGLRNQRGQLPVLQPTAAQILVFALVFFPEHEE